MRLPLLLSMAWLLLAGDLAAVASSPAPEPVDIAHAGGALHAQLARPPGEGPFPAVIALHDCGGLADAGTPLQSHYADWTARLLKSGYAVLWPDSYGSRELGPQCQPKDRRVFARRQRVDDIMAARHWLAQQPWVQRQRIGLIGWGNGASALLWAVRPQSVLGRGEPDFRAAVAFYPDCRTSARLGWSARAPTLLLIGGNDDISSPAACRSMIDGARGRSALARIVAYPGAYHGFDRDGVPLHLAAAGGSEASGRGHLGSDPVARRDAERRAVDWLGR